MANQYAQISKNNSGDDESVVSQPSFVVQSDLSGQQLVAQQYGNFWSFEWLSKICQCFTGIDSTDVIDRSLPMLSQQAQDVAGLKTLVLDLDETLVHSQFDPSNDFDMQIQVKLDSNVYNVFVNVRQGTTEFLDRMAQFYEIVVFTASLSEYADPLLDKLDVNRRIKQRLYRENCVLIENAYVKDLSLLGRELKNVIIIDNSPKSYSLQPQNAIPIVSWYYDKQDTELMKLIPALEYLSQVDDVTQVIMPIVQQNLTPQQFTEQLSPKVEDSRAEFNSPMGRNAKSFEFD